jgi:glutaconyl-CoA/methylmalonyl-CoA decarboxylase subunit gamma
MIKKLRVTVDSKPYEVTVEMPDESGASAPPPPAPAASTAAVSPPLAPVAKISAAPGDVQSPLMGRIVAIDIKLGQKVEQSQQLLTIETMKMNTFVLAPKAGKVAEILVAVGDAVEEGRILARIA